MSPVLAETPFTAVAWLVLKATLILAAAALLQTLWRRRTSAAARHLAWTAVVASLLLLPFAWRVAPRWSVAVTALQSPVARPAPDAGALDAVAGGSVATAAASTSRTPVPHDAPLGAPAAIAPWTAVLGLYAAGVAAVLLSLGLHHRRMRQLAARAVAATEGSWPALVAEASATLGIRRPVRLLRSREVVLPMTFGTWSPAILMPATAELWNDDRRRAVILHELAHVARYDCLTQTLALVACAAYWPHPAVWWVARQLRVEREMACDDRVLAAGAEPHAYAGHLLDIAYALGGRRAPALAVSMARPSQLEGRLLAALDGGRNRRAPGVAARVSLGAAAAVTVVALAGATPVAIEAANRSEGLAAAPPVEAVAVAAPPAAPAVVPTAAAAGATPQDDLPGTWELRPGSTPGMVHLRLAEGRNSHGTTVPRASIEGLTEAQLTGAGGPVQFRITRDAGTLQFDGVLRNGVGAGTFSFAPNAAFPAELEKRGFTRPNAREQYQLARADVGYAFLDELNRLGYAKPDTAGLVTAAQHGVNTTYLREMGALGYALGSLPPLITLRDHGVTPDYVRGMAEAGYDKLPADTIRKARDHGVGPEFVRGMREAGYTGLSLEALIKARDHGVTPDYARAFKDLGYDGLTLDDLRMLRDHGVTPDRVRSANARAGSRLPIDLLRSLADGGGLR
jgi:beta-lactamase regulating signal transducer with metallopeptidase domain